MTDESRRSKESSMKSTPIENQTEEDRESYLNKIRARIACSTYLKASEPLRVAICVDLASNHEECKKMLVILRHEETEKSSWTREESRKRLSRLEQASKRNAVILARNKTIFDQTANFIDKLVSLLSTEFYQESVLAKCNEKDAREALGKAFTTSVLLQENEMLVGELNVLLNDTIKEDPSEKVEKEQTPKVRTSAEESAQEFHPANKLELESKSSQMISQYEKKLWDNCLWLSKHYKTIVEDFERINQRNNNLSREHKQHLLHPEIFRRRTAGK